MAWLRTAEAREFKVIGATSGTGLVGDLYFAP